MLTATGIGPYQPTMPPSRTHYDVTLDLDRLTERHRTWDSTPTNPTTVPQNDDHTFIPRQPHEYLLPLYHPHPPYYPTPPGHHWELVPDSRPPYRIGEPYCETIPLSDLDDRHSAYTYGRLSGSPDESAGENFD